jgi:hypothetical protein
LKRLSPTGAPAGTKSTGTTAGGRAGYHLTPGPAWPSGETRRTICPSGAERARKGRRSVARGRHPDPPLLTGEPPSRVMHLPSRRRATGGSRWRAPRRRRLGAVDRPRSHPAECQPRSGARRRTASRADSLTARRLTARATRPDSSQSGQPGDPPDSRLSHSDHRSGTSHPPPGGRKQITRAEESAPSRPIGSPRDAPSCLPARPDPRRVAAPSVARGQAWLRRSLERVMLATRA